MTTAAAEAIQATSPRAAINQLLDAFNEGSVAIRRAAQPVSEWAAQHMRTERGEPLDFDRYPHMRQVMDDRSGEKGMMCGSQTGKTTTSLADVYHFCDTHHVTAIVTMPTAKDVAEFSKTRAKPAIQASPYLRERMGEIDAAEIKTFGHKGGGQSTIFFRGATAETQALSIPADLLYHDEIDRSRPDIVSLYRARTAASIYDRRIVTSTPTVPKFGIHAYWEDSSQTQWLVKCPVCGDERALEWPGSIATDADPPFYICAHGHELTRETIRAGRWVDKKTSGYTWRIYHTSRMLMDLWPAERVVAIEQSQEYRDYPELFHNDVLGLPKASGELAINEDVLAQVMVGYPQWEAAPEGVVCFAGCDQSPRENEHRVLIGAIDGEGCHSYVHLERCGWDRLAELMHLFRVQFLVVDAMPETSQARKLRDAFPGRVFPAWYSINALQNADAQSVIIDRTRREESVKLDRTAVLDRSARRLIMQEDYFPGMDARTRETFVAEMTNMSRATELDAHGQPQARWIAVGPDHYRHTHTYATIAAEMLARWSGGLDITYLDLTPGTVEKKTQNPETGEPLTIRYGYIPQVEGVIGTGELVDWRKQ